MDEFQIEAFLYVVQTKNFSRAAEMLHVTQSTVTSRIKALETRYGKPLLNRTTRHVELTNFGAKILPHLTKISETFSESLRLAHATEQYDNSFSVGMIESAAHLPIVPALGTLQDLFPKTSVHLMTSHSADVAQAVIDGTIDVGMVYSPPKHPALVMRKLCADDIVLIGNSSFMSAERNLYKSDIDPQYLVRLDWNEYFSKWFSAEFGPNFVSGTKVANANLALQIVTSGKRLGFFPNSLVRPFIENDSLKILPYTPSQPIPQRIIYVIHLKAMKQTELVVSFLQQLLSLVNRTL